jgi:hypothetical protein
MKRLKAIKPDVFRLNVLLSKEEKTVTGIPELFPSLY